jgi:hydroxyacylglutathione hydrolase
VGLDRIVGYVTPATLAEFAQRTGPLPRTETIDMAEMEARRTKGVGRILDVRSASEFESGHVPDAVHIPHTRVGVQRDGLPPDASVMVYCNSGARAAAAVSLLERLGYDAVEVNDLFANYRRTEHQSGAAA